MAYSHSKLKAYDECQLRYRYKYIDKIPEPKVAAKPALFFGTIIHAALELLYKKVQTSGSPLDKEDLKQYIQSEMQKARDEHDRLSDQPILPEQYHDYLSLSSQIVDRYYETYHPFTSKVNGLEKMFSYTLPNAQKFTGIIDRLDVQGDTMTIVDYKTDKDIKSLEDFSSTHKQQMTTYAARVLTNYPHITKTVRGKLIYLRLEHEVEREITSQDIEQVMQSITDKISEIEHRLFVYNMGEKEAFGPNEGVQCRRCAYQVMCPLRKHKFQKDEVVDFPGTVSDTTIKKLIDKFYTINQEKKLLEDQLAGLKSFLEEYVAAHSDEKRKKIYGDTAELRVDYAKDIVAKDADNKEKLKNLLIEKGMFDHLMISINTKKLTTALQSNPGLKKEVVDMVQEQEKYIVGRAKLKKA